MTSPPPALANPPQFTAEYWDQAPRDMVKVKLARITHHNTEEEQYTEFVFDNGEAFQRKLQDLDVEILDKLHANSQVFVQVINGQFVTGLFVPDVGWLFKMTGEDIAEYTRRLSVALHNQREQAREQARAELVDFMAIAIREAIFAQLGTEEPVAGVDWQAVASAVMGSMAEAEPPEQRPRA